MAIPYIVGNISVTHHTKIIEKTGCCILMEAETKSFKLLKILESHEDTSLVKAMVLFNIDSF